MKILLAGNRGYLGSVLQDVLMEAGHESAGLDTGFFDADPMQPRQDVRDVTAADLLGCDAVVNLAALCNDACGDLSAAVTHEVNTTAAASLARLAKSLGIKRYVLASSCSVYGVAPGDDVLTENDPVAPETAYATSKVDAERALFRLTDASFQPVALRFATLFGDSPSFRSDLMVNRIAVSAHRWNRITMNGDGTLWRPLLHVRDAARAILAALEADAPAVAGKVFNVGFPEHNHRVADVVEMARSLVPGVTVKRTPAADSRSYAVCFDKFHETFPGFEPSCSVIDGLREVIDAYHSRLRLPLRAAGDGWAHTDRRERLLAMRASGYLREDFRWRVPSLVVC
jgi:nucleoside-diphosphate-sugar epimerase